MSTWMVLNQHRYSTAFAVGEFAFGLFFPDQADYIDAALQGSPSVGIAFAPAKAGKAIRKTAGVLSRYQLEKYGELIIEKLMSYTHDVGSWDTIGRRLDASGILRNNMKKAGHLMQVHFANAAHHIMPVGEEYKSKVVIQAQAILQSVGIGPEHPANGVLLRFTKEGIGAPHGVKGESNIHTKTYANYVAKKIINFTDGITDAEEIKSRAIEALQEVGIELLQGKKIW